MRKRWWVGGGVAVVVAGMGSAVAWRAHSAKLVEAKKKADEAVVALEFAPAEVVRPKLVAMSEQIY